METSADMVRGSEMQSHRNWPLGTFLILSDRVGGTPKGHTAVQKFLTGQFLYKHFRTYQLEGHYLWLGILFLQAEKAYVQFGNLEGNILHLVEVSQQGGWAVSQKGLLAFCTYQPAAEGSEDTARDVMAKLIFVMYPLEKGYSSYPMHAEWALCSALECLDSVTDALYWDLCL